MHCFSHSPIFQPVPRLSESGYDTAQILLSLDVVGHLNFSGAGIHSPSTCIPPLSVFHFVSIPPSNFQHPGPSWCWAASDLSWMKVNWKHLTDLEFYWWQCQQGEEAIQASSLWSPGQKLVGGQDLFISAGINIQDEELIEGHVKWFREQTECAECAENRENVQQTVKITFCFSV